ncbi:MAG: hypothetical protein DPW16_10665 [Chloroflexi bacterium]|nr:hypothetical protein [Chloroflexota bacterium]
MTIFANLQNRIDLTSIPYTDRGSRLMLFRRDHQFYIRISERWVKYEAEMGHYRQRPPMLDQLMILDENHSPVNFTVESTPYRVDCHTPIGDFTWCMIDPETYLLALPAGRFGMTFEAQMLSGVADRRGGTMQGKSRRNIAYTTNAHLLRNEIHPAPNGYLRIDLEIRAESGQAMLFNVTPRLGYNRTVPDPKTAIDRVQNRWRNWLNAVPPVLDEYRAQYDYAWWVMAAGLMNTRFYFTREAMSPSKIHYVGAWHWDQFFHALAYRHVDAQLAEDQLRIFLDHQRADGMIPDAIHDEGVVDSLTFPIAADVTKPPLIAWTALKLYEHSGHRDFIEEVYEPIQRWHNWWVNYNRDKSGLYEYHHPFSSGLDDCPLWDEGLPVIAPDLNAYLILQQESLGRMAEILGDTSTAQRYRQGAENVTKLMMEMLWDEEKGVFRSLYQNKPVTAFTLFNLMPLFTGRLSESVNRRLIAHLTDPAKFWTQWPLATVAIDDPSFDAMQMWRGPTWANINYLFVDALRRVGQPQLADELAHKTLRMIMQHPDIYEYYNPITGERPPKSAPIFGWTSAVFIDLAIQLTRLNGE